MKLADTIIISLVVVLFVIGVHQTFVAGFIQSYWIFMLMLVLLYWFQLRKKPAPKEETKPIKPQKKKNKKVK